MFERFEPAARQAFLDARSEAGTAGQRKVRSEHILLGLLAEPGPAADALTAAGLDLAGLRAGIPRGRHFTPTGLDPDALASVGIDLDAVRRAADAAFGPGSLEGARSPARGRPGRAAGRCRRQADLTMIRQFPRTRNDAGSYGIMRKR
jgi:hypothetical protein